MEKERQNRGATSNEANPRLELSQLRGDKERMERELQNHKKSHEDAIREKNRLTEENTDFRQQIQNLEKKNKELLSKTKPEEYEAGKYEELKAKLTLQDEEINKYKNAVSRKYHLNKFFSQ